jgi:hypothetical protein
MTRYENKLTDFENNDNLSNYARRRRRVEATTQTPFEFFISRTIIFNNMNGCYLL